MRKKKSEILNIIKEEIISNYKSYILVIILFSVGLFLGVLFINQTENQENVIKYINTYIDEIKISESNSTIVQLKTDIKNNIFSIYIMVCRNNNSGNSDSFWNNYSKRILLRIYNICVCNNIRKNKRINICTINNIFTKFNINTSIIIFRS